MALFKCFREPGPKAVNASLCEKAVHEERTWQVESWPIHLGNSLEGFFCHYYGNEETMKTTSVNTFVGGRYLAE